MRSAEALGWAETVPPRPVALSDQSRHVCSCGWLPLLVYHVKAGGSSLSFTRCQCSGHALTLSTWSVSVLQLMQACGLK